MSVWRLVKLNFGRTPVHFGEVGIGIEKTGERVKSDTLFSAWITAYARLFGKDEVEHLLTRFLSSPPVRMSSTFVYRRYQDTNKNYQDIYYLPRPLQFPPNYPDEDLSFFKSYKKLKYLPLPVWQRWYQGKGFTESDREQLETETKGKSNGWLWQQGTFDYGKAYQSHKVPRISVDRTTRATNLYHTGLVQFQWESTDNGIQNLAGLYFLLEFPEEDSQLESNLKAALHLLGEDGLGGERSTGAGRFEVESFEELPEQWQKLLEFPSTGSYRCLLSLLWENEASKLTALMNGGENIGYEILERGGWVFSPFSGRQSRRQMVRMFAEGSVFAGVPEGTLADVTPTSFQAHSIYRNGIGLSLPIQVKTASKDNTKEAS